MKFNISINKNNLQFSKRTHRILIIGQLITSFTLRFKIRISYGKESDKI